MIFAKLPAPLRGGFRRLRRRYPLPLVASDLLGFVPAFWVAGLLRNEVSAVTLNWLTIVSVAAIAVVVFLITGWFGYLYRQRHRVATFDEVFVLGAAWMAAGLVAGVANLVFFMPRVPTSVFGVGMMLAGTWMLATRVGWRLIRRAESRPDPAGRTRILVFGAGEGGESVIKSMLGDSDSRYLPVGLIDDDPRQQNRSIEGIRVLGTRADIGLLASRADTILIAVPSASSGLIAEVAAAAERAGLEVMVLPSTTELFGMMATIDTARPLQITDLLGRDEVQIDDQSVADYLSGRVVLVTGAGGSIGSELCRQIMRREPGRLIMLDRDETALHNLQLSLTGRGLLDDENLVLANIRDRDRVFEVFDHHRPSIVFHAAALKHLPLLESHPREGLMSNVFGTKNVLDAAKKVGVEHFVNVSTDKAANPTSVLGSTKRLAEALTVQAGADAAGEYISVRFGNVIGSRGSVLPAFEKQIAAGGPVTVTHRDVTRFFMSIPEASRLVLQAGAIGKTGETLVLDMGEPMKIVELAERLIRHYKSDAKIVFTGLRPNEKLHEELGHDGEEMVKGDHPRIWHTKAAVLVLAGAVEGLLDVAPIDLPERLLALTRTSDPKPSSPELSAQASSAAGLGTSVTSSR